MGTVTIPVRYLSMSQPDVGQPLPVGEEGLDGQPSRDLDRVLPVRGKDEVVGLQGEGGADLYRFLAFEHGVGPETALTLQGEHPAVEGPGQDHSPVHLLVELGVEPGVVADQAPVGIDDPKAGAFSMLRSLCRDQRFETATQSASPCQLPALLLIDRRARSR